MRQAFRLGVGASVLALAMACSHTAETPAPAPPPAEKPAPLPLAAGAVSPRELVASRYRLPLDRRRALAAVELDRLLGGSGEPVRASWDETEWKLAQGTRVLGRMPELPSYADGVRLLDAWAAAHPARRAATAPAPPPAAPSAAAADPFPSPRDALALARAAGLRFAQGDRAALGEGAHALAALALQVPDPMGRNDGLAARALALASAARAAGVLQPADEVLLAAALGHRSSARTLAAALDPAQPVRAYALGDDRALEALESPGARRLRLRRFVERQDDIGARRWLRHELADEALELPVLAAQLELKAFDEIRNVAIAAPFLLALHAERDRAGADGSTQKLLSSQNLDVFMRSLEQELKQDARPGYARLDAALERLPNDEQLGPFLRGVTPGQDLWRQSYRSLCYAAMNALGTWAVVQQSNLPLADEYARGFAAAGSFADARGWLELLRNAAGNSRSYAQLAKALEPLPFSGAAVQQVLSQAIENASYGAFDVLPLTRVAASHLDTRIDQRAFWSRLQSDLLADGALSERLARGAVAEDPERHWWLRLRLASLDGTLPELRPLLGDDSLPEADRLTLLDWLATKHVLTSAELRAEVERLHATRRWNSTRHFIELLEQQGDTVGARQLAEKFLKSGDREGLNVVAAQTAIARTLQAERRYAEAWQAIEPAIESYQSGALQRGALVLFALGRHDEAFTLARRAVDRYPSSAEPLGVLAELLWRAGRHAEAAQLLAHPAQSLSNLEWRSNIAPHFVAAADAGAEIRTMFAELLKAKVDPFLLRGVPLELASSKQQDKDKDATRSDLVVEQYRSLRPPGFAQLEFTADAARVVLRAHGANAAKDFLLQQTPAPLRDPLAQFALARGLDDALWTVVPLSIPKPDNDAFAWLCRAAASLKNGAKDPHHEQLLSHFRADSPSHYHVLGRYLLGLTDERSALAVGKSPHDSCEVAYWVGFKAEAEHRIADAMSWYRTSIEADLPQVYESRLAHDRLAAWRGSGKSVERLATLDESALQ